MKTIEDLTTDEKTKINAFFEENEKQFNKDSFTHLKDIESLFFIYDNENKKFISFGKDCNDAVRYALKWSKVDCNALLEHLNIEYEFLFINLRYKPTLY